MHAMTPFFQMILNFEGFEFVAFWLGMFIGVLAVGFFLDMIMQRQGFGVMFNGLLALAGAFLGLYLRFNYFLHAPWYSYEPYLTTGLCFGVTAVMLVSLAFMRNRFWS